MAKKKLTLTPFARLFIVLLFAVPLSYIGASYYNGEDGIENIKNLLGIGSSVKAEPTASSVTDDSYDLKKENEKLRQEIKELRLENEHLRRQIERGE